MQITNLDEQDRKALLQSPEQVAAEEARAAAADATAKAFRKRKKHTDVEVSAACVRSCARISLLCYILTLHNLLIVLAVLCPCAIAARASAQFSSC